MYRIIELLAFAEGSTVQQSAAAFLLGFLDSFFAIFYGESRTPLPMSGTSCAFQPVVTHAPEANILFDLAHGDASGSA